MVTIDIERIGGLRGRVFVQLKCQKTAAEICHLHAFVVETYEHLIILTKTCHEFEDNAGQHLKTCCEHTCLH